MDNIRRENAKELHGRKYDPKLIFREIFKRGLAEHVKRIPTPFAVNTEKFRKNIICESMFPK